MGEVLSFPEARNQRDAKIEGLWSEYLAARDRAELTRDINDGIRAGKAWAAWLDAFRAVYP